MREIFFSQDSITRSDGLGQRYEGCLKERVGEREKRVIKLDEASFSHLHKTKKFLQIIVPCTVCATVFNCVFLVFCI